MRVLMTNTRLRERLGENGRSYVAAALPLGRGARPVRPADRAASPKQDG